MEPYILTQEDIDKLLAAGGSDAMPGEVATPQDLQLLGITCRYTRHCACKRQHGATPTDVGRAKAGAAFFIRKYVKGPAPHVGLCWAF
jgi:hypothetical protein